MSVAVENLATGARGVDVLPIDDLIRHEFGEGCPCGPKVELHHDQDGADVWIHVHASLDGREVREHAKAHA
ncbi:hypothetical protein [Gryllotalpicola koreensis]